MAKHQPRVVEETAQYVYLVECDYAPLDTHYIEGQVDALVDWPAAHISSAIAAGIIKSPGGVNGENSSA